MICDHMAEETPKKIVDESSLNVSRVHRCAPVKKEYTFLDKRVISLNIDVDCYTDDTLNTQQTCLFAISRIIRGR